METKELYQRTINRKKTGRCYRHLLIDFTEPVVFPYAKQEVDPYLVGVLIGDGGLTQNAPIISTNNEEIIKRIINKGYEVRKMKSKYGYRIIGGKKIIPKELRGKKSENKYIPKNYLYSSLKQRWELLRGLMDTDGYISDEGHCSYSTSSLKLANDFQRLVWSLGFKATIQIKKTYRLDNYNIHLSGAYTHKLFTISRKKNGSYKPRLRIKSIKPVGFKNVKCIEVEGGYFLLKNFIVTHNSYLIRWALIALLIYYFRKYRIRGIVVGLFCEDYPALKDRHLTKVSTEFPAWLGTMHSDHKAYGKSFILSDEYGGGVLAFRNLDKPEKYASAEFAAIGVDELTKNTIDKFIALRHRLRWKGVDETRFIGATNPGSVGHEWVKKYWIDKEFPPEEMEKDQFVYVPAKYTDNPYRDSTYEKTLNSLPPKLAKAFRDGNWDVFEGQFFDKWNRDYNTCQPFSIPKHWLKFIWLDYGYTAPSAVGWATLDEIGRVYVYRELYTVGLTYTQLAKKIKRMTPEEEVIDRMIADPAIFAKSGHGDEAPKSGAEEMVEATNGWLTLEKGNNDRIIGWNIMRQYIEPFEYNGKTTSKLIFFNTCRNAIRTIPSMVYDSTRIEDLDTKAEDHAADMTRYGLMDLFDIYSKKIPKPKTTRTTDDIFNDDMQAAKKGDDDVDWLNI